MASPNISTSASIERRVPAAGPGRGSATPIAVIVATAALLATAALGIAAEPIPASPLAPEIATRTASELQGLAVHNRGGLEIGVLGAVVRDADGTLVGVVRPNDAGPGTLRGAPFPLRDFELRDGLLQAPTDKDAVMLDTERIWGDADYRPVEDDVPLGELAPGATPAERARTAIVPRQPARPQQHPEPPAAQPDALAR
jgi:hypothetical protein